MKPFNPKKFAEKLKELRLQKGLTQKELGIQADVSLYWIRGCERGKMCRGLENLNKIADFFGCSVEYLFGRTDARF